MAIRGRLILSILFMIAQFCTTQIYPELWTIPIVCDEHGNLSFGDLCEQNETAEVQPPTEPQLTDGVDLSRILHAELAPVHVSQPQAIRIPLTDEDIESVSADLHHPVYTLLSSAKVHQTQEPVATDTDTTSIDTDLGTLLDYVDLGPLPVDIINIEPLVDSEMDTSQVSNALTTSVKHQLNTASSRMHLQTPEISSDYTDKKKEFDDSGAYQEHRIHSQEKSPPTESQLADGVNPSHELHVEPPPVHVSQPKTIRIPLTDEDKGSVSADLYHPLYTVMCSAEVYQVQEIATNTDVESIDTDLETLLACGDLGPLSVDDINIDGTEMEIFLTDTSQVRNALMTFDKHRLSTSDAGAHLQVLVDSFDSTEKDRNGDEERNRSLACPECSASDCDQSIESIQNNSGQILLQCGFFKDHFINQTNRKPFQCDLCSKEFRTSSDYRRHRRTHTGEKPFQCELCPKQFITSSNYQSHRRIHTGEKPFQCDICSKQFRKSNDHQKHRRIHTGEKPFQCELCSKEFRTSSDYQRHRRTHTGEKPFQCELCSKEFRTSSDYQRHRRTHTGEKPFQCDLCPKQFITSSNYQSHRRIHIAEKPFQCDICPKQFRTSSDYQKHRRVHTGEKPFQCDICGKQFRISGNYQRHHRIHTGEKPLQCELCPKQFSTSSDYQRHRRIHTGEKPFQCDICPKQFRTSSDYQVHRRIHTGEKPFQCDICSKQFRKSNDYQKHRRVHTGEKPFQCDICPKQFRTSSDYQRHRRTHAVDESYICYWCNQNCCSKHNLIKHIERCSSRNSSYTANPVFSSFISSDKWKWTYMQ